MKTNALRLAALAAAALALSACGRPADSGTAAIAQAQAAETGSLAQSFELKVDGRNYTLSPDLPKVSQVPATVMDGGTMLSISAMDRGQDLTFALSIRSDQGPIGPGSYPAYHCGQDVLDCSDRNRMAMLAPYPTGKPPDMDRSPSAWLYPALGLQPVTVTIESMSDVTWNGVGPAKRVKGHFAGTLAHLEQGKDGRSHVVPPTHPIEGAFDLYAQIR